MAHRNPMSNFFSCRCPVAAGTLVAIASASSAGELAFEPPLLVPMPAPADELLVARVFPQTSDDTGERILALHAGAGTVSVYRPQGGSLVQEQVVALGLGGRGMTRADLDGDEEEEVVVALAGVRRIAIIDAVAGDALTVTGVMRVDGEPQDVAAYDIDSDGDDDLAVVTRTHDGLGRVHVLRSDSDGLSPWRSLTVGPMASAVELVDLTRDGLPDFVTTHLVSGRLELHPGVLESDGSLTFGSATAQSVGSYPVDVVRLDDPMTGRASVGVSLSGGGGVSIVGYDAGEFTRRTMAIGPEPRRLSVARLNDGSAVRVLTPLMGETRAVAASLVGESELDLPTSEPTRAVAAIDLDRDGRPEIITAGVGVARLSAFVNASPNPDIACVGDLTNDLDVDGEDFGILGLQFGTERLPGTGADFNADGRVDGADFGVFAANFGRICGET